MEYEINAKVSHKFTDEDLNDLVTAALEGGINYWCDGVKFINIPNGTYFEYPSEVISIGGKLMLCDIDSDETWELDREKLLKGIQMYCEQNNVAPSDLMDLHDADVADAIVQYAVFNELTFS